jgi:hypothetical protein
MANAGLLVGLNEVSAGRGFELRPYVSGYLSNAPGRTPPISGDTDIDVGIDAAYNITPSLRGVGTVNTDFAETEVDQRLVNLTRFPLFLPERRTFFLDGATFFDFPLSVFFSRRIGLVDGRPQPIVGGGKLTGQAGRYDTGALYVRTADTDVQNAEDFLVGRVRRRIFQQSYLGAIYTVRNTYDGLDHAAQQTAGVDFRLATATFRGNKNLSLTSYWAANSTEGDVGDSAGFGAFVEYPNDIWEMSMDFQEIQPNYDPAIGFTPRREFRRYNPDFNWNPRPRTRHPFIRRLGFGVDPEIFTDLENRKQSVDFTIQPFRLEAHSGDNIEVNVSPSFERLDDPFEIADGVTLPPGSYDFIRYSIEANTANRRVVALRPSVEWGTFFNGKRKEYALGLDVRPRPGVRINTQLEYNTVDLVEGSFDTKLVRTIVDTQFSPFIYLSNNIQYDSVSAVLGWQARFRWIVRPGNDIFFVYTHNWIDDVDPLNPRQSRFRTLDNRTAAKAVYTKRF